jgi:hypothetical protein
MAGSGRRKTGCLARGHVAVGLGLLSGACGADTRATDLKIDDRGLAPGTGGRTGSGAGGSPVLSGAAGGGGPSTPSPGDAGPGAAPCDTQDSGASAAALLTPYIVDSTHVGRRTLYSWTTAAQIEELRQNASLLTRSASVVGERGRATDYLLARAATDPIAAILTRPEFEKKRFGWTNAWATALGWEGETYGDQLLQIRLRAEAWIGRISTSTDVWAFFDTDDRPVDPEEVKRTPERVAGYYFSEDKARGCGGTFFGQPPYREYVIFNEDMIEEWSVGTPEILSHLTTAILALEAFRSALQAAGCTTTVADLQCFQVEVIGNWERPGTGAVGAFESSLAFPNGLYVPTAVNVEALISELKKLLFTPAPLTHSYSGDARP